LAGRLPFDILPQPDDTTCGPTCLHAVYNYYGDQVDLTQLIPEVRALHEGGTFAVFLASHALRRGYGATIYTYNLQLFDPTWFAQKGVDLRAKLEAQGKAKDDPRLREATTGYLEYLDLGGVVKFEDLTTALIRKFVARGRPILTGLSATYLHHSIREYGPNNEDDDVRGSPVGHFVVLCGYDRERREVLVADPLYPNPMSEHHVYAVPTQRVLAAIPLGIITHDANLLILDPPEDKKRA
jgi:hypothetical protein